MYGDFGDEIRWGILRRLYLSTSGFRCDSRTLFLLYRYGDGEVWDGVYSFSGITLSREPKCHVILRQCKEVWSCDYSW